MPNNRIPSSPEAELAVVGAILNGPALLDEIQLSSGDFWDVRARYVFEAARDLADRGQPLTPSSLTETLKAAGLFEKAGGGVFIAEAMTAGMGLSLPLIRPDLKTIRDKAKLRLLLELADRIRGEVITPGADVAEILTRAEAGIFQLADSGHTQGGPSPIGHAAELTFREIEERQARGGALSGVPSGFYELDAATGGFEGGQLIIGPAGTTSSGKTAMALQMAENAAKNGYPVLFFSLEMTTKQLAARYLSRWAELSSHTMKTGAVTEDGWGRLVDAVGKAHGMEIYLDDTRGLHVQQIRSRARAAKRRHGIGMVICDYLQLVRGERQRGDTREREIASISAGLKEMAGELDIPVVALAQLNRQINQRAPKDRKPRLSDLRESGALEQDADLVLLLDRPEMYDPKPENRGEADLIIAKHRGGPVGTIPLLWRPERTRFDNQHGGAYDQKAA